MSMMRWSPLEEMDTLRKQIDSIFTPAMLGYPGEKSNGAFVPPVEVLESENAYKLRFLLPGIKAEEVNLEATAKTLSVSGEVTPQAAGENERVLLSQFRFGKFSKQLTFPDGIESDKVEATYTNGILEVVVPKAEASQKRNIQIKVN